MTPPKRGRIERRVFVVGVPRSGTTLVQSLLAAHSRVTSFTESHFFSRSFRPLGRSSALLTRDPSGRVNEFLLENGFEPAEVAAVERLRKDVPSRPLLPLRGRAVARRLLELLDELSLLRGDAVWVEKTPRHLRFVPFLERVAATGPPTSFVHVIRNGLETVASLRTASRNWERPYDLEACVRRWNTDLAFSLGRVDRSNDRFVFYEELTSRPEATLESLLAGLRLTWEPEVLERYARVSERLITNGEPWKAGLAGGPRPSATSEKALTARERERARASLRFDLYERLRDRMAH